jgi:hypothetical protein
MRLTKYDKEIFVKAVMRDIPSIDFSAQAHALVLADIEARMPEELKALKDDPRIEPYLHYECVWLRNFDNVCAIAPRNFCVREETTPELYAALKELNERLVEQSTARAHIHNKLFAVINSCSTLKQAQERLPEFLDYLPQDRESMGTSDLPAITGLVIDLTAMGWPKGKDKEEETVPA